MRQLFVLVAALALAAVSPVALADPAEDVAAATQSRVDRMNHHDAAAVLALYDPQAVLWGTRSPTLRDNPTAVRDYFKILDTVPPSYKVVVDQQRIRVYGDVAINTGAYTFSEMRDDKPLVRPARFSFVFRKRDGRWLIVDHHSSAVPAPH